MNSLNSWTYQERLKTHNYVTPILKKRTSFYSLLLPVLPSNYNATLVGRNMMDHYSPYILITNRGGEGGAETGGRTQNREKFSVE